MNQRYVANQLFGIEVDWDAFIKRSLDGMLPPANYLEGKQLLLELYETYYGLHDHLQSTNPLASVMFHEGERYLDRYLYDNYLDTFLYKRIYEHTGLSFDAFLAKPRYEIEKILKKVIAYNDKKSSARQDALDNLSSSISEP